MGSRAPITSILDKDESRLFFDVIFGLFEFVSRKYNIAAEIWKDNPGKGYDVNKLKQIANEVWSHTDLIDEYIASAKLPCPQREIATGFKSCCQGRYFSERHLKQGRVFISPADNNVYMVRGLVSTFDEMFDDIRLPVLVDAVLLPFCGKIVTDGLMNVYPVIIGKALTSELKNMYMTAKQSQSIRYSL